MESHREIENLLEKYFEGETSLAQEQELHNYFSSDSVAANLEKYRPMFGYFKQASQQQHDREILLPVKKVKRSNWMSIAASAVILLGVGTFAYVNQASEANPSALGTYDDPETALRETQKALDLLAGHVNTGVQSVEYINEYEQSKNLIFKN